MTRIPNYYTPMVFKSVEQINILLKNNILINQTNTPLDNKITEVLCLGLDFIPSTTVDKDILVPAVQRLTRDINVRLHFLDSNQKSKHGWLAKFCKTEWEPETLTWSTDERIVPILGGLSTPDLAPNPISHKEVVETIDKINKRTDVHILKSDKGRNTVIWRISDYDREATRQLSDTTTYTELSEAEFMSKLKIVKSRCQELSENLLALKHITAGEDDTICKRPLKGSSIYFLPKIHKPMNKDSATFPGRPIVATFTSTTYLLDKYITELTKPLLKMIPGSLMDTMDFIQRLPKETLPSSAQLTTADVTSLYPSIPWDEGITAATAFYAENLAFLQERAELRSKLPVPSSRLFREILSLILCNSLIEFKKGRFFHQIKGTAMGCCISVYFANCYMFELTRTIIENPSSEVISFLRFIDDIFLITIDKTANEIQQLFNLISNANIHYEINTPSKKQDFLDTTITINNKHQIISKPFSKETASGSYLHPGSTHPRHTIKANPYSQLLRLRRISSNRFIFKNESRKMRRDFRNMGYSWKLVNETFSKTFNMKEEDLLPAPRSSIIGNSFKFITTFHHTYDWRDVRSKLELLQKALIEHYSEEGPNQNKRFSEFLESRHFSLIFSNNKRQLRTRTKLPNTL